MNNPVSQPTAAASDPVDPQKGGDTGPAAVEALARILDPEAFDPPAKPRDVGVELYRQDRRRVAVLCATRAVAAGYRLREDDRAAEIRALESALEAARGHARTARSEGLDRETCRFWSGICGWLRSRIRKLTEGIEPDWPDAARSGPEDREPGYRLVSEDADA